MTLHETENLIIKKAGDICKTHFMDFPDYDPKEPLSLAEALAVIVTHEEPHDSELAAEDVYDLLDYKLN